MSAPGNFVFLEGDTETREGLRAGERDIDDFLYELVDETAYFAQARIKTHAPGHIDQLAEVDPATEIDRGRFEAVAGVEPDITEESFTHGLGSDPADYPVFVEVGTGIYGPVGEPISTIPGHLMGPIFDPWTGTEMFTTVIKGQKPQHYTEHAFEDTVEWLPGRIRLGLHHLSQHH